MSHKNLTHKLLLKIFSEKIWLQLIAIQILFLLICFVLFSIGNETFVQFPIFYGWLVFPITKLKYFASSPDTVYSAVILYFFLIPIIFFLFSILIKILIKKRKINQKSLKIIIGFHFLGGLLTIISSAHEPWLFLPELSLNNWLLSTACGLIGSYFFWKIFFKIFDRNYVN